MSELEWIAGNDTGTSSKAIWSHMMTGGVADAGHPRDCSDFGRCYRLLLIAPHWVARITEMGWYTAEWKALAERWGELTAMFAPLAEAYAGRRRLTPSELSQAETMRAVMDGIFDNARVCADCGVRGMSGWTTYPRDVKRCSRCADVYAGREPSSTTIVITPESAKRALANIDAILAKSKAKKRRTSGRTR